MFTFTKEVVNGELHFSYNDEAIFTYFYFYQVVACRDF